MARANAQLGPAAGAIRNRIASTPPNSRQIAGFAHGDYWLPRSEALFSVDLALAFKFMPVASGPTRRRFVSLRAHRQAVALASMLALSPVATAQQEGEASAGGRRGLTVVPALTVSLSYSDNRDRTSVAPQSEVLAIVTPSIRLGMLNERVRGSLDYSLNAIASLSDRERNDMQHSLSASLVFEPVQRVAFVDLRASIARQSVSAFGIQAPTSGPSLVANQSEQRAASVSPYLRGSFGGGTAVEARFTLGRTSASGVSDAASTSRTSSLSINGGLGTIRWTVRAADSVTDYDRGRETQIQTLDASAEYTPHYDWRLTAHAGRERSDVLALASEARWAWGLGARWTPSVRTEVDASLDQRYFGRSHRLSFLYRTPRTVWRVADVRDTTTDNPGGIDPSVLATYDRLYIELAGLYPNPVERDQVIRQFLRRQGGLITSAVSLQRRQDFSGAWNGNRANAMVSFYRTTTSRLDKLSGGVDDLSQVDSIEQTGANLSFGYRLTPTSSLSAALGRQRTADRGSQRGNTLDSASMSLAKQLGSNATMSVSLRHSQFDAPTPYTENSASVTFSLRF